MHDARVCDRRHDPRFVEQPPHDLGLARQPRPQHLDRRAAAEQRVLGEPDLAHPAAASGVTIR